MIISRTKVLQIFVFLLDGVGSFSAGLFLIFIVGHQFTHAMMHIALGLIAMACAFHPTSAKFIARLYGIYFLIFTILLFLHVPFMRVLLDNSLGLPKNIDHIIFTVTNLYFGFFFRTEPKIKKM